MLSYYYFNFRIQQLFATVIVVVMNMETVAVTLLMWDVFVSGDNFH